MMIRMFTFALAGLVSLGAAGTVGAQQTGAGQAGAGQAGAGQGQSQQSGQTGKTGQQQGNWSSINQTPWFANQGIRQQLNLSGDQLNQLNKAYGQAYGSYQKGLNELGGSKLSTTDRMQRQQELENNFYKNFSSNLDNVITDPEARQRFNQMSWQYRGYGAFNDPMVQQKLNLTPEQRQKLNEYYTDWTTHMNDLSGTFAKDSTAGGRQYEQMRKQYDERVNSVLNQQQQQAWRQMTGERYNFQPNVYFPNGNQGSKGGQGGQQGGQGGQGGNSNSGGGSNDR